MSYRKFTWWERNRPSLEFYFSLWPLVRIQTVLLHDRIETLYFEICRLELYLFKKKLIAIRLYKRPEYAADMPPTKLQRLAKWLSAMRKRYLSRASSGD